jgi:chromosome segregation ATPase
MNLDQAQLERRNKELDAKEAYIDAKAKILEDAPITLKVYEARVKAFETKLNELTLKNKQLDGDYYRKNQTFKLDQQKHEKIIAKLKKDVINSENDKQKLQELKKQAHILHDDIIQQKKWADEQQKLIDESVKLGNEKLMDLQDKVTLLHIELNDLKIQKNSLERDIQQINYDKLIVEQEYQKSIDGLEVQNNKLKLEHQKLVKSVSDKSTEYKVIIKDLEDKLSTLKEKESSIGAKRDAMRLERQELDIEKRRFNSAKSLYED